MNDTTTAPQPRATLVLEDGTRWEGRSFGAPTATSGEVVFNTAMTGYPESLTDPSYYGQILVTTYPILGNYGAPPRQTDDDGLSLHLESLRIHPRAIIAQDYTEEPSHWQSASTLGQWLRDEGVAGLCGIDTRALTQHLREHGSMLGRIEMPATSDDSDCSDDSDRSDTAPAFSRQSGAGSESSESSERSESSEKFFYDPNKENLVALTSCRQPHTFGDGDKTVVLVDCGIKHNIVRHLVRRGLRVVMVPWDYDFTDTTYDGLFISNGPGDPDMAGATVEHIRRAMAHGKPICGICMGNQLLAKAAGARIYKLKYGHRGHNQPVKDLLTGRCYITSQNHGFAVDATTLPPDWQERFTNLNDGTNEGIAHRERPWWSAQFHPEACSGPLDTEWIFDDFVSSLRCAQ